MNDEDPTQPSHYQRLTAPGPAAIALLRLCGPDVAEFAARHLRRPHDRPIQLVPDRVFHAALLDQSRQPLDDVVVSCHATSPVPEIRLHLHGSAWVVERVEALLHTLGFSPAQAAPPVWTARNTLEQDAWHNLPGMMTLRGTRWLLAQPGRLANAINDLLQDPDDDRAQRFCRACAQRLRIASWFQSPLRIALVGPPNAGKSTLANALANATVSLISDRSGTTRDWIEIPGELEGYPVCWLDTAGLRAGGDPLEIEGMTRTRNLIAAAHASVLVLDSADPNLPRKITELTRLHAFEPTCIALNKCDHPAALRSEALQQALPTGWNLPVVRISARDALGLHDLAGSILSSIGRDSAELERPAAFTHQQAACLEDAAAQSGAVLRQRLAMLIH